MTMNSNILSEGEKDEVSPKKSSLSEYLHDKFDVILDDKIRAEEKITVVKDFHAFVTTSKTVTLGTTTSSKVSSCDGSNYDEDHSLDCKLHLPLVADRYLTFHPSKTDGTAREPKNTIHSGIKLPSINWQSHFRKGYSLLMWIRIQPPENVQKGSSAAVGTFDSHVLYRFATTANKSACGIQATLHSPKSSTDHQLDSNSVHTTLRVETLEPKGYKVPNALSSSRALITPLALPLNTWTLLGIQHYLPGILQNKKPVFAVHIDGDEVFRDEMVLPAFGNDAGDIMSDNYLLCNMPNRDNNLNKNGGLRIGSLDLASVGLYKDVIPGYMQGIVSEYGPCVTSDGVVPVIPPVAQCRDAVIMSAEGRVKSNQKNAFGLKVNSRSGNGVAGRGVGVPLSKGLLLNSDGNVTGDVHVQKFLSKLVLGINSSNALLVGEKRVVVKINTGCSIGMTGDVPKIGICQPKLPLGNAAASSLSPFGDNRSGQEDLRTGNFFANCMGDVTLHHSTDQFLKMEQCHSSSTVPHYDLPSSAPDLLPMPSFLLTYISIDPLGYILQPFHLALPPPGYSYSLQLEYYHKSFDHLYDLIVYRGGAFAAHLINLFAANLSIGGEMREQILQSGGLHILSNLLRRVLSRAGRLGMLTSSSAMGKDQIKEPLWKVYSSKESPNDEVADVTSNHYSSPGKIPPKITHACGTVIKACCGPILTRDNKDRIAQHIRRTSDLALTAVFGLALDLDLWGGDYGAAASILREVVLRYCCIEEVSGLRLYSGSKHDNGYGWLIRGQMTVQYLLDIIRLHFNRDTFENGLIKNTILTTAKDKALTSLASSFSSILYTMLKYSLSSNRSTFRGEHDVTSAVAALSDCPLGSLGAHIILNAMRSILVYCEIINVADNVLPSSPKRTEHDNNCQPEQSKNILNFLQSVSSPPLSPEKPQPRNNETEESLKLRRVKSDMAARLGRNLLMARFHDVVGPMLLSRTVFDWRRAMMETNAAQVKSKKLAIRKTLEAIPNPGNENETHDTGIRWQYHWRLSLSLFIWLASIAGPEGEIAAKSTGSLLFHSGKAGSLSGCLLGCSEEEGAYFNSLLVPPTLFLHESRVGHTNELSHRFRIMMSLLAGLVVSLTSKASSNSHVTRKGSESDGMQKPEDNLLTPAVVDTLTSLIGSVTSTLRYLHSREVGSLRSSNHDTRQQNKVSTGNGALNKMSVKAAKEAVPPILTAAALLNGPIQEFRNVCSLKRKETERSTESMVNVTVSNPSTETSRNLKNLHRTDSDVSWVDVTPSEVDFSDLSSQPLISLGEQLRALKASEERLLNSAGILIMNAMAIGGGEGSTLVWRVVVSTLASCCGEFISNLKTKIETSETKNVTNESECLLPDNGSDESVSKYASQPTYSSDKILICRLAAMVFTGILSRQQTVEGNPSDDVELCSATARLCDLVEEKELLQIARLDHMSTSSLRRPRFSEEQVHLLCALLDIMENGRSQAGWCQSTLPVVHQGGVNDIRPKEYENKPVHETPSLLDESIVGEETNGLVLNDNEVYHQEAESLFIESFPSLFSENLSRANNQSPTRPRIPSKMLLPILQPCLRIILSCLGQVQSKAMVIVSRQTSSGIQKSLLSKIIEELHRTLIAAIVGLTFSNARDVCLHSLSCLRKAIELHKKMNDLPAVSMCNALVVAVVNEMRVRYLDERNRRENEQHMSFLIGHEGEKKAKKSEGDSELANANEIESLLVGNALIDRSIGDNTSGVGDEEVKFGVNTIGSEGTAHHRKGSESDDFIFFAQHGENTTRKSATPSMGWSNYRGFGVALERCHQSSVGEHVSKPSNETTEVQHHADLVLEILSSYLDTWDAKQTQDDAESELVEIFGENANLNGISSQQLTSVVSGSETAADSMSSFIELASSENSRITDIQRSILSSRRCNRMAFAERYSWKYFMIFSDKERYGPNFFERCMSDGGLEYGARLVTNPIHPQFPRHIPRQLDHTITESHSNAESDAGDERRLSVNGQYTAVDIGEIKTLVEKGSMKIVDVTKKSISVDESDIDGSDCDNVLVSRPSAEGTAVPDDDDDNPTQDTSLDFPEATEDSDGTGNETDEDIDGGSGVPRDDLASYNMNDQSTPTDGDHNFITSSFADPPNGVTSCLKARYMHHSNEIGFSAGGGHGFVDLCFDNCLHVKAHGSRSGVLFLTQTFLIFEYTESSGLLDGESMAIEEKKKRLGDELANTPPNSQSSSDVSNLGEECRRFEQEQKKSAAVRPKSLRWNISELSHIYLRRYRLRDSALELFFLPSGGSAAGGNTLLSALSSVFLDFGPGRVGNESRDDAANAIMKRAPAQTIKQWPEKSGQVLHEQLRNFMKGWMTGRISNFDYLLSINCLAGRSFNDLCQYPVFPWVLSNYKSEEIPDLTDKSNFRDLTKPMGALNPGRLIEFIERFETFQDAVIPPFMYGSHYSTSAGVVLHFLVRMHPFAELHRQLQGGHFDVADRLFSSVARTWDMCTGASAAEVKELTPEWYCNPSFLRNSNNLKLGTSQDGELIDDVVLPPWAKGSPEKFVEVLRSALESDICSEMLPSWIDLIFGRKQQGPAAVEAHNVFFYLTYYGSVDVASLEDEDLRTATELQIAHFGQCPMQLFWRSHLHKAPKNSISRRSSLSEMLQLYELTEIMSSQNINKKSVSEKPFQSAPLSYWVHLPAPPPGPHAPLVAVRMAGPDRCLAIDAQGIIHCFKWAWKADLGAESDGSTDEDTLTATGTDSYNDDLFKDKGCFVAQRELPHFRSIPRLCYSPQNVKDKKWLLHESCAVVAISKSLFAARTLLLVISDGDGKGSLCMELVDPVKGLVKGQVLVPSIHSSRITAIHMDPMGIASGVGGVGGELAIVGSEDGTATLWRFISSQFLPLRPRLRLGGHKGARINAVAVNSALNICITVSHFRCCIFNMGNGVLLRSLNPPSGTAAGLPDMDETQYRVETTFAETNALCVASGHIILLCKSKYYSKKDLFKQIVTLQLYTAEGVHLGSKALEAWRGVPHKICSTFDGRAIMVCCGRGISIHMVSALMPLHFVDEWRITDDNVKGNDIGLSVYDVDFGPSPSRPVVVVASCSSGALRLHALKGINSWSEENRKGSVTEAVGNALAKPALKLKNLVGNVKGTGSRVVGFGKDLGREALSDVKSKGMTGLFSDVFGKK